MPAAAVNRIISPVKVLILNNTGVGDMVGDVIMFCPHLEILELAGTRVTSESLPQVCLWAIL